MTIITEPPDGKKAEKTAVNVMLLKETWNTVMRQNGKMFNYIIFNNLYI